MLLSGNWRREQHSEGKVRFPSSLSLLQNCWTHLGSVWKAKQSTLFKGGRLKTKSNKYHASLTCSVLSNWKSCTSQCVVTQCCTALLPLSPPPSPRLRQQMGNLSRNVTSVQIHITTLTVPQSAHLISVVLSDQGVRQQLHRLYLWRTAGSAACVPWWPDAGCACGCRQSWRQMAAGPQSPPGTERE